MHLSKLNGGIAIPVLVLCLLFFFLVFLPTTGIALYHQRQRHLCFWNLTQFFYRTYQKIINQKHRATFLLFLLPNPNYNVFVVTPTTISKNLRRDKSSRQSIFTKVISYLCCIGNVIGGQEERKIFYHMHQKLHWLKYRAMFLLFLLLYLLALTIVSL